MIITSVEGLRDPFILAEDGKYYLYGTGVRHGDWENTVWDCYVNDSGSLQGEWKRIEDLIYEKPRDAKMQFWAPEMHKYKGAYYLIASYYSSETNHRGSSILRSDSPVGPFVTVSDGHVTPREWDCIDATLYVDKEGQPWLVFVHEWTCTEDKIGRMAVAKLSEDLSRIVSEPVELFRADSPSWSNHRVTDGCFLYTTENKKLLMLWSNFENKGYCVGIAHSESGLVIGPWTQEDKLLFKKGMGDEHDGGHGMIFTDFDGQKYLCCHSPNKPCEACRERTVLIPVCEDGGTIRVL